MAGTVNRRIKEIRKSKKITQNQMAEILGMKYDTYSKMERMGTIDCEMLLKLTSILETDAVEFLYDKEERATIKSYGIIAKDNYEKLAIIAIRNLPSESKREIYEIIIEKFVNVECLINGVLSEIR